MSSSSQAFSITYGKSRYEGRIHSTKLSSQSVTVTAEFDEEVPPLPIGMSVETEITGSPDVRPVQLPATIYSQQQMGTRTQCTVTYPLEAVPQVGRVLNQRADVRVLPTVSEPIRGVVEGDTPILVRDISRAGVGLLVGDEVQDRLWKWSLTFTLTFPSGVELEFVGRVRVRRKLGSYVLLGCRFDAEQTEDFVEKQKKVHEYVMSRQAEMVRARMRRNAG